MQVSDVKSELGATKEQLLRASREAEKTEGLEGLVAALRMALEDEKVRSEALSAEHEALKKEKIKVGGWWLRLLRGFWGFCGCGCACAFVVVVVRLWLWLWFCSFGCAFVVVVVLLWLCVCGYGCGFVVVVVLLWLWLCFCGCAFVVVVVAVLLWL